MKKAALFDLDGVIVDTETKYTEFWSEIGKRYCPDRSHFEYSIKGMSLMQIFASDERLQAHEHEIRKDLDAFELSMSYPYIAGAPEFVGRLHEAGIPAVVVTSSNRAKMENVYRVHPYFRTWFHRIFTAEDCAQSKPAPDCYLNAAKVLDFEPSECVVFEDSLNGLRAGRAAGAYVVGLSTSHPREEVMPLADLVVPDFLNPRTCLTLFDL